MERSEYLEIRKNFKFEKKPGMLALSIVINAALFACCWFTWSFFGDSYLRFLSVGIFALFAFRNFSLMHEAAHNVTTSNSFLNDTVGIAGGCFCFLAYDPWKQSHMEHHLWSGNVDKDPVMALINLFPTFPKWLRGLLNFSWQWWIPTLGLAQNMVFWYLSIRTILRKKTSLKMVLSVVCPLLVWGTIFAVAPLSFSLQVVLPGFYAYMIFFEVVGLPHHLTLPQQRGEVRIPVWNQYKSTRSCVYPKFLARFAVLNFNYHVEHHVFPDAPWYYLEQLHEALSARLKEGYNSDESFSWTLQNKSRTLDNVLLDSIEKTKKEAA